MLTLKQIIKQTFFVIFFSAISFVTCVHAQQPSSPETELGVKLYNEGKYAKAMEVLQKVVELQPSNKVAWRYLGLSYYHEEFFLSAGYAFDKVINDYSNDAELALKVAYASLFTNEPIRASVYASQAINLGAKGADVYYVLCEANFRQGRSEEALTYCDEAIRVDSNYAFAHLTKSMLLLAMKRSEESADNLNKFLQLRPNDEDADFWREQLASMLDEKKKAMMQTTTTNQEKKEEKEQVLSVKEVTQKAVIQSKPQPEYSEKARKTQHSGVVHVQGVLASNGTIQRIRVVKPLRYGLNTNAVNAFRGIKFIPALKDGRPVSQWITVEYNYRIY